ncbi:DUF6233 domain-containing protein [Streptomyces sp. NPDC006530]|uniref:DUF6233 domain-containing protein n=1 Tax=Streptomyces sp. NPDC006530 TaxID=3364750 RepID=UPI00368423C0
MTAPVPITLYLPDGQMIRVRLYERAQRDDGCWVYRIGVPLWQTALDGVEPVEYGTWVTAGQLRPIPGVDLGAVPTTRRPAAPPTGWVWLLDRPVRGPAVIHADGCRRPSERARPLRTEGALDALAAPGTVACAECDAAEVLVPILHHGQTVPQRPQNSEEGG